MHPLHDTLAAIRLVIFDVDGVLTDGRLYFDNQGGEYKAFHSRDGHGMKLLQQAGVPIAIITGRQSALVAKRMDDLGITHVYQGNHDKLPVFEQLLSKLDIDPRHICYVGDDILDLPVMTRVGLAVAVADAHPATKAHADYITQAAGGQGAAREICDLILSAQNKMDDIMAFYLR